MKKLLAAAFLVLSAGTCTFAQNKGQLYFPELEQKSASVRMDTPLLIVNGAVTTINTLILSKDAITNTRVFKKGTPEAKKYAAKDEKDVALLSIKKDIQLLKYEQILDHFNIPASDRKFKVSINRGSLVSPELILADLNQIEKVEVAEAGVREFANWGWNQGDKFLNIVTKIKD